MTYRLLLSFCTFAALWGAPLHAQKRAPFFKPSQSPFEFGMYAQLGLDPELFPRPAAGLYADWTRHRLGPGLDLRAFAFDSSSAGTLVGPRLRLGDTDYCFYGETLFGPAHAYEVEGVAIVFVAGAELRIDSHLRFRGEYSQGVFSEQSGAIRSSSSVGFVVHFP